MKSKRKIMRKHTGMGSEWMNSFSTKHILEDGRKHQMLFRIRIVLKETFGDENMIVLTSSRSPKLFAMTLHKSSSLLISS